MKKRATSTAILHRPSFDELEQANKSMLGEGSIPVDYARFAWPSDVRAHILTEDEDPRVVRLYIAWDVPLSALDDELREVLDRMIERGAAIVTDAKLVTR